MNKLKLVSALIISLSIGIIYAKDIHFSESKTSFEVYRKNKNKKMELPLSMFTRPFPGPQKKASDQPMRMKHTVKKQRNQSSQI